MEKQPCVYILSTKRSGTLYIGVTSNLIQRIWQHKNNVIDGFTKIHAVHTLVWYEFHSTMESAIRKEKQLKKWNRQWKLALIGQFNAEWKDLYRELCW